MFLSRFCSSRAWSRDPWAGNLQKECTGRHPRAVRKQGWVEEGARPQKNQPHADSAGGTDVNHRGCPTQRQGGWAVLPLHPSVTGYWPPWMRRVKGVVLPLRNLPTIVCRRGQGKLLATQPAAAGLGKAPGPGTISFCEDAFPCLPAFRVFTNFLKNNKASWDQDSYLFNFHVLKSIGWMDLVSQWKAEDGWISYVSVYNLVWKFLDTCSLSKWHQSHASYIYVVSRNKFSVWSEKKVNVCFIKKKYKGLNHCKILCRSHSFYRQCKTKVFPPNVNYSKYFNLFLPLIISLMSHCVETSLVGRKIETGKNSCYFQRGALSCSC